MKKNRNKKLTFSYKMNIEDGSSQRPFSTMSMALQFPNKNGLTYVRFKGD